MEIPRDILRALMDVAPFESINGLRRADKWASTVVLDPSRWVTRRCTPKLSSDELPNGVKHGEFSIANARLSQCVKIKYHLGQPREWVVVAREHMHMGVFGDHRFISVYPFDVEVKSYHTPERTYIAAASFRKECWWTRLWCVNPDGTLQGECKLAGVGMHKLADNHVPRPLLSANWDSDVLWELMQYATEWCSGCAELCLDTIPPPTDIPRDLIFRHMAQELRDKLLPLLA